MISQLKKLQFRAILGLALFRLIIPFTACATEPRERLSMDSGWRFQLGDPAEVAGQLDYPEGPDLTKTKIDEIGRQPIIDRRLQGECMPR